MVVVVPKSVLVLQNGPGCVSFGGERVLMVALVLRVLGMVDVGTGCARAGVGSAPSPWCSVGKWPGRERKSFASGLEGPLLFPQG